MTKKQLLKAMLLIGGLMENKKEVIGVIGAGVIGTGVAQRYAVHGYEVVLLDISEKALQDGVYAIKRNLKIHNMLNKDKYNILEVMDRIKVTLNYQDIKDADFLIENVVEDMEVKKQVYTELNQVVKKNCYLMVNSSCISITRIGSFTDFSDRIIGVHYMNPVPEQDFAEVIKGTHTSENTCKLIKELLLSVGIDSTMINDSTGYVTNRVSHIFMNEAMNLVLEGVAKPEQVDKIFVKCFHHTMGPLATADLIGLDTVMYSLKVLYDEYQDPRFRCSPLLKRMVDAGTLGRKSGKGFYDYE
jgi:3-hydroxyacyl-CoA dehydrogenase, NAD-binding